MCEDLVLSFVMFLFQPERCVVNYEMRVGGGMARARHLRLTALLLLLEVVRAGAAVLESEVGVEEVEETFSTVLLGGNKTDPGVETLSRRSFCSHGIKPFPGIRYEFKKLETP